jgi:hypothetical protein
MWKPLLIAAGGLACLYHFGRRKTEPSVNLDAAISASFRHMSWSPRGMENAQGVYKELPHACVGNVNCRIYAWRFDGGEEGVWDVLDIIVRDHANRLVLRFKDSRLVKIEQNGATKETFDIEEDLLAPEILRRVRHALVS